MSRMGSSSMDTEDDNWFHGKISRDISERLLFKMGEDGAFLVRESSSLPGDYVLSVLHQGTVNHYQIRRHGGDAYFSINERRTVHGLDKLIQYCRDVTSKFEIPLTSFCKGLPPPHESKAQGSSNLLHRVTGVGVAKIVESILNSSNCSGLRDSKNESGKTPVHLAALAGRDDILIKLIASGAKVNVRDGNGYTPLHYTCQNNFPSTTELLITKGRANYQIRHEPTGHVPLHDAAQRGHIECIKVLLKLKAPAYPRVQNAKDETPADIALQNRHLECVQLLQNYKPTAPNTSVSHWYHGPKSRLEAEATLQQYCKLQYLRDQATNGVFLVRYSKQTMSNVLTLLKKNRPDHFLIQQKDNWLYIDSGPYFESPELLIEHYRTVNDGLGTKLTLPVPPNKTEPHSNYEYIVPPYTNPKFKSPDTPSHLNQMYFANSTLNETDGNNERNYVHTGDNANYHLTKKNVTELYKVPPTPVRVQPPNSTCYQTTKPFREDKKKPSSTFREDKKSPSSSSPPELYISWSELTLAEKLGEGAYGCVFHATYYPDNQPPQQVAVKTLPQCLGNKRNTIVDSFKDFLNEATVMMSLRHPCIVRLIGFTLDASPAIIQELVPLGPLPEYLREHPEKASPNYEMKIWAAQIASGMEHLASKLIVHRDLAARNILLAHRYQVKICDFGLSRELTTASCYQDSKGGAWPLKWYAPECYNWTFSHASDVWSFGVTIWEMYSYGQVPYGNKCGQEVIELIENNQRLEQPEQCPDEIYRVMMDCWAYNPDARPTFKNLMEIFSEISNYVNMSNILNDKEDTYLLHAFFP